jgi:hypothetical protein
MPISTASLMNRATNDRDFAAAFEPSAVVRASATGRTAISRFITISERTLGAELEQTPLGDHQVRQAEQRHQLRGVLGQSTVTDLLQSEAVLDDMERMLDLGANTGLDRLELVAQSVDLAAQVERTPLARAMAMFQRTRPSASGRFSAP